MLLIREVYHCKPGKVRPLLEKFKAMAKLGEEKGWGKPRLLTDLAGERYWTLVMEFEVESMEAWMKMGESEDDMKEFEQIMKDYHDYVQNGHREIYNIEY